jgi:hypothetical protein
MSALASQQTGAADAGLNDAYNGSSHTPSRLSAADEAGKSVAKPINAGLLQLAL